MASRFFRERGCPSALYAGCGPGLGEVMVGRICGRRSRGNRGSCPGGTSHTPWRCPLLFLYSSSSIPLVLALLARNLRRDVLGQQGLDGLGQVGAKGVERVAALAFGEAQHAGGRVDEAARSLVGVTEQALPQGQRVNRERQAIDQSMPAASVAAVHGVDVTLQNPLIAQRAQLP